jgi:predicted AAA+ superfamily ATPase
MVRNNLTNERELLELVYYLASNAAKLSSNNSLAKTIGIKNATTVKNYIDFLHDTYFLFQVRKYDPSLKKQLQNPKKTYFIDNALVVQLGFSFSGNWGRLLENLVFIELMRRGKEVYYHRDKGECDFIIRTDGRITEAIQVCYLFDEPGVAEREIKGLCDAMDKYGLKEGSILTTDKTDQFEQAGKEISVKLVWDWLISK